MNKVVKVFLVIFSGLFVALLLWCMILGSYAATYGLDFTVMNSWGTGRELGNYVVIMIGTMIGCFVVIEV